MKKILGLAMVLALCGMNEASASEQDFEPSAKQRSGFSCAVEIQEGDLETIRALANSSYPEGLPANIDTYTNNMVARKNGGNSYNCYLFNKSEDGSTVTKAAVGFGRMPVTGYKGEEHADILNQFISLGVIQKKNPEGGLEDANLERVENYGLGVILPILPQGLPDQDKFRILEYAKSIFEDLKNEGRTLPLEHTTPLQLIGLFHPEDPILSLMKQVGFEVTENEGFFKFYDKPRVMAHIKL